MLEKISAAFSSVVKTLGGKSTITEKNIEEAVESIKMALLDADVNLRVVRRFVNGAIDDAKGERVLRAVDPGQQFVKMIYDRMTALLGSEKVDLRLKGPDTQSVIMLVGLQGAGKTTAAQKLARRLQKSGRRPLLAACDLARPAAIEQLSSLGAAIGVPVYSEKIKAEKGAALGVALNALDYARKNSLDTVIVDTAGRLQIDEPMMEELSEMKKALRADETILAADAMTGQNAADIARAFNERLAISGAILTKFDSDTRGGAALSLKSVALCPILFIGTGEKADDLEPFHPDRIASRLLGMGDIVSLVEKAQETVDEEAALSLQKRAARDEFTLDDMLAQFEQVEKMGSVGAIAEMMPGVSQALAGRDIGDGGMKKKRAMIQSMTKKERANHLIIGPARRKRIAKGSASTVAEVNKLLKEFEKTKLAMKKLSRDRGLQAKLMARLGGGQAGMEALARKFKV